MSGILVLSTGGPDENTLSTIMSNEGVLISFFNGRFEH